MTYPFDEPRDGGNGRGAGRGGDTLPVLFWVVLVFFSLMLGFSIYRNWFDRGTPALEPRPVAPRGDLASDEQTTIDLFKASSPSVVFVSTLAQPQLYSRSLYDIPQGTGSGYVWDNAGDIVTNYHVIASIVRGGVA